MQRKNKWWIRKSLKSRKLFWILWKRSAVELRSISVHSERLQTCPDRLHRCCVLSTAAVLPPLVSFCWEEKIMLLLRWLLSFSFYSNLGPTDDETFLPFSGSFWKCFLIFRAYTKKTPLICVAWRSRIRISHIPKWKTTKKTPPLPKEKISSTYHVVCDAADELQAAPGCETSAAGRCCSRSLTPVANHNQHVGLFRLVSEATRCRSRCLIHRWPWSTKCPGSKREIPTLIPSAEIPVSLKET